MSQLSRIPFKVYRRLALLGNGTYTATETLAAGKTLTLEDAQILSFNCNGTNRALTLPTAAAGDPDGAFFLIANQGTIGNLTHATGNIAPNQTGLYVCSEGTWDFFLFSGVNFSALAAGTVAVGADSFAFLDATDNVVKLEALADFVTAIAGVGLAATAGVLALDLNELTAAVVDVAADSIGIIDANASNASRKEAIADVITAIAGVGLGSASGVLSLDLNELTAATVDVTADSIAIIDANASNGSRKESIDDLVTALAGDGIQNTSSQLAVDVSDFAGDGLKDDGSENLAVDLNELTAATVDVAADSIAIIDATDNGSKKEAVADVVSAVAGAGLTATAGVLSLPLFKLPMAVYGTWTQDGDGVLTNSGGLVGCDATQTEQAAGFAKTYDLSATEYQPLSTSSTGADYTADYQLLPDTVATGDYFVLGAAVPFCEFGIDMSATVQTYTGNSGKWQYWDGSAWADLTCTDQTDGTAQDGLRTCGRDGIVQFVPPSDWAASEIDSQTAYWLRWIVTDHTAITQIGLTASKEHLLVSPTDGWIVPFSGSVTGIRACDGTTGTLHSNQDVKFLLMNYTSGAHSGVLTWAQDQRCDSWSPTLVVTMGDTLGVLVTQDDGAGGGPDEVINALLELIVTPS